jgi:hypothetical protein
MLDILKTKTEFEIYKFCEQEYLNDEGLKSLREYVKANSYGFCDDAHYTMWRELVKLMPDNFKFLEIGVFKGQIICLLSILNDRFKKNGSIFGVTPLENYGDKYSEYPNIDYSLEIKNLFQTFSVPFSLESQIINGLSTDDKIKQKIKDLKMFDLVYVDGGHDYDTVISDLILVKDILNINGYIVTDDSSCYKNLAGLAVFTGHLEVCDAIKDNLEPDKNFVEILCVGHNRVFKKIK